MNPNSAAMMDAYGPQQSPYTPTTAPYSPFTSSDQRSLSSSAYQSMNRSQAPVKSEPMATPVLQSMSLSSPGYPMDTTTSTNSHPLAAGHLGVRKNSVSNPGTPMSYLHPSQTPTNYYPQDQPMVVDMPTKQRQSSGFRRVRNVHDLQPRVDTQPQGRRIAGDGSVLSVRSLILSPAAFFCLRSSSHSNN
jgi:dual specificity protein kinase YAK1